MTRLSSAAPAARGVLKEIGYAMAAILETGNVEYKRYDFKQG
jgi:hypothetical protein